VKWVYIAIGGAAVIYIIIVAPEVFTSIFDCIGSLLKGMKGVTEAMPK